MLIGCYRWGTRIAFVKYFAGANYERNALAFVIFSASQKVI